MIQISSVMVFANACLPNLDTSSSRGSRLGQIYPSLFNWRVQTLQGQSTSKGWGPDPPYRCYFPRHSGGCTGHHRGHKKCETLGEGVENELTHFFIFISLAPAFDAIWLYVTFSRNWHNQKMQGSSIYHFNVVIIFVNQISWSTLEMDIRHPGHMSLYALWSCLSSGTPFLEVNSST